MSEPSSGVPGEIADAEVEQPTTEDSAPDRVELDLDEEKVEAWDEVKSDYEVEPGGEPVPNSMDPAAVGPADDHDDDDREEIVEEEVEDDSSLS